MLRALTFAIGLIGFSTAAPPAWSSDGLRQAMAAISANDWDAATNAVAAQGSIAKDIVEWHRLRDGDGGPLAVLDFLQRRPDWPGLDWLRKRSEPAFENADAQTVLAFFDGGQPQSAEGAFLYASALQDANRRGEAQATIVLAWRTMPMDAATQDAFVSEYRAVLAEHHVARLDQMIWQRDLVSARRMLPLVDEGNRRLAEARIGLLDMVNGVDGLIAAVPDQLSDDPGLAFARFEWRMRKRRHADAIAMLYDRSASAERLGQPDAWLQRRRQLARDAMQEGRPQEAYRIAANHFTTPNAGYGYADLEWIAGYVALRQLGDPTRAATHFERFDAAVDTPISKGRAGYWLGRAYEAMGDTAKAKTAYEDGARYQTSYYGILAAEKAGKPFDLEFAQDSSLPPWRNAPFTRSDVFEAGLMLLSVGQDAFAERFLTHLAESLAGDDLARLGGMAIELKRPHLAVMLGKRAAQAGAQITAPYYAVHPVAQMNHPVPAELVLSIARRESEFDPKVISGAGARGLMQVMPATGRHVARNLGITSEHTTGRMVQDWKHNARLGAAYLAELVEDFEGNPVLVAAAYNAGPARPERWMLEMGDPRRPQADIVDWIELIPFAETRNYVMRVAESLPIYRARLGLAPLPVPFSEELKGSGLSSKIATPTAASGAHARR